MSNRRVLALGLMCLLLGGCAVFSGREFQEPEIQLVGLRPIASKGMEARFEVVMRVVNPNDFPLKIDGVFYEVYLRERKVLTGASSTGVDIPAFDEGTLTVEAGIGLISSLSLIGDLLNKPPQDGVAYLLKTKIELGNFPSTIRLQHEGVIR